MPTPGPLVTAGRRRSRCHEHRGEHRGQQVEQRDDHGDPAEQVPQPPRRVTAMKAPSFCTAHQSTTYAGVGSVSSACSMTPPTTAMNMPTIAKKCRVVGVDSAPSRSRTDAGQDQLAEAGDHGQRADRRDHRHAAGRRPGAGRGHPAPPAGRRLATRYQTIAAQVIVEATKRMLFSCIQRSSSGVRPGRAVELAAADLLVDRDDDLLAHVGEHHDADQADRGEPDQEVRPVTPLGDHEHDAGQEHRRHDDGEELGRQDGRRRRSAGRRCSGVSDPPGRDRGRTAAPTSCPCT